uniref:Uncharacterized protein n=1 Tax=viral metagenome TaxID=1070528 RepID=A0A6M3K936_9ZZZZ
MTTPSGLPDKAPTIRQMRFGVGATRMRLVALSMRRIAQGLAEMMPGKMDAMVQQLDEWTQAVTDAERLLREVESHDD